MNVTAQDFQKHLNNLAEIARRQRLAYRYDGGVGRFDQMSEAEKALLITGLKRYNDLLQDFEFKGLDFSNTVHLLGAGLKKLGFHLPKGLFEKITPTDFVEIYTSDLVPVFRSPNFWETSSYANEEIYTNSYENLFERSEFYQAALNRAAKKVFTGESTLLENPVPEHLAWEKFGTMKVQIKYKYLASCFDFDGMIVGALVVCELKPLAN